MMHPARTTRPNAASAENRRASQKAGSISELGVFPARQIGNFEKASAETSPLTSTAVGAVRPQCWSKDPRAFPTSFCGNLGSRNKLAIPCRSSGVELTWIVPPPPRSSVANDAHRRVVHESAWRRPTPCGIDLPTINDANGRNRFCAHALHFDTLRDERTGDENRLLSRFFLSLLAPLDRRIGKRSARRD
jgi:hypothetical protein